MKRFLLLKKTVYDLKLVLLREFGFCTGFLCIVYSTGMFDVFGSLCYCYGTPFNFQQIGAVTSVQVGNLNRKQNKLIIKEKFLHESKLN